MKHNLSLLLICLLALGALASPCLGAELPTQELTDMMDQFRKENGLHEGNFSICYYNTVTKEEYRWNDTRFMAAGSTFKLPLNLYYYDLERAGKITPDTTISGVSLEACRQQTLVWSDNELALAMLYRIGSFRTYKNAMLSYFTMEKESIPSAYYTDNNYCTAMMLDALKHLYSRSRDYEEMLDHMKQAQPENYFRLTVRDYEIAHKYGFFEGAVNDVGIVYTPQPFLLAVFTQDVKGEEVLGRACQILTDYTISQQEKNLAADTPTIDPVPTPAPAPLPNPEPLPQREPLQERDPTPQPPAPDAATSPPPAEQVVGDNMWWMILIAAGIFLVGDLTVLFFMKKRTPEQVWESYEKKKK